MRIALIISSLGPGGAERVMALLAGGLATRGHEVWLITLAASGNDFFLVDPRVRRIGLGLVRDSVSVFEAGRANVRRLLALRRAVSSVVPDVVLSFMTRTNVLAILACTGLPARLVVSERVDPVGHCEQWVWAGLRALVYKRADVVVVQTETMANWFRRRLGDRPPVAVIPNPVVVAGETQHASLRVPKPFMLAAGRLVAQKGFDILIRAFALVARECEPLRLAIAGEGPETKGLRGLVAELHLDGRVLFLGPVRELQALMLESEAFILSSRYEGFPNVLLEALANGLPVVATDCPGASREILRDGEFGVLVPCEDPPALAAAIRRLATDADFRNRLSMQARVAIAPYALTHVVSQWEEVFQGRVVARSSRDAS